MNKMIVNKNFCMSSFLMFRTIIDSKYNFKEDIIPKSYDIPENRIPIKTCSELANALSKTVLDYATSGKAALALSGGIDSAILAKYMPKGSTAYTFKCVVPGIEVTDESPIAAKYAEECGLHHRIVEVFWEDFEELLPKLMVEKGAPVHSIEVQIYKAALQAKKDGFDYLIFGESADCLYGGLSNVLSRDWKIGEFIDRYAYLIPYHALKESIVITDPFVSFQKDGNALVHEFFGDVFFKESINSYMNACRLAGIQEILPYAYTFLDAPLDYDRVRKGENKYLVREIFMKLYEGFAVPPKTPMPRPMNEWLANWEGPKRSEFWPNCVDGLTGDQKWLIYSLESFLNIMNISE